MSSGLGTATIESEVPAAAKTIQVSLARKTKQERVALPLKLARWRSLRALVSLFSIQILFLSHLLLGRRRAPTTAPSSTTFACLSAASGSGHSVATESFLTSLMSDHETLIRPVLRLFLIHSSQLESMLSHIKKPFSLKRLLFLIFCCCITCAGVEMCLLLACFNPA